ncbi:MAG: DUF3089 domain-containing protein [Candidatus Adiutrix sp.]|jgi:hypothetical protein|nr:DUF3089 domain-containing protein [Candidatus Adiutrix sp.]
MTDERVKKTAGLGARLALIVICLLVSGSPIEAQTDSMYRSFDSFDPSEDDFSESAPPAAPGPASGRLDLPEADAFVSPPPPYDQTPYDQTPYDQAAPAGPPASGSLDLPERNEARPPASGGLDLPDPGAYDYPAATDEYQPPAPAADYSPPPPVYESPAPPVSGAYAPLAPSAPPAPAWSYAAGAGDYSQGDNWLMRPDSPDRSVDVFYLYPGACARAGQGGALCGPGDPGMRQKARELASFQAGVFETVGNLYAPYYSQANSVVFLGLSPQDRLSRLSASVSDSVAAFDYYLKNHNGGRPYILAAHGQGTATLLAGILSHYLKNINPAARGRMVAAYALGYSVNSDFLNDNDHLRFAERRDDVGVIISYNTEAPRQGGASPALLPQSVAINPINWSRSQRPARANQSRGANLSIFGGESMVRDFADARVNLGRGVVECSTVSGDQYLSDHFPGWAYPAGDYAFYYYDLRQNAQDRAEAFMQSRPALAGTGQSVEE